MLRPIICADAKGFSYLSCELSIPGINVFFFGFGRHGAVGSKPQRQDLERRATRESRAIPAPDANAELVLSMQVTFK